MKYPSLRLPFSRSRIERLTRKSSNLDEYREWREVWRRFRKNKIGTASLVMIVIISFVAIFADVLAPYDPNAFDFYNFLASPSGEHWLGTDDIGRDVLSRLIHGARISLFVAVSSITIAMVFGGGAGLIGGFYGGWPDSIIMRFMDMLYSFPAIFLAIVIMAYVGGMPMFQGEGILLVLIIVIGVIFTPRFARLIRSSVLSEVRREYILAARSIGISNGKIILRHLLPNTISPLIVLATLDIAIVIILESSLSFIGLGSQPPTATWGAMLAIGRTYIRTVPLLCVLPGLAIMVTVLSFNIMGDALRDAMDPTLRED